MPRWHRPVAAIAALFGLATLVSGGRALFGGDAARAAVGDAVPLVLWFNFAMGAAYLAGAAALFAGSPLARGIAWTIGLATAAVFAVFIGLALTGTPFEWRTVGAMVLRSGFWLGIALALGPGPGRRAG
ncbi:hypothetical protein KUH32_04285 [Thalassococcus sp. CAU 1522]|uniref:DUF423 domain-containing protein n=2 Tax=Thalassococcus arenae TaxID=2851652 RepID=A0ABS6N4P5_9RHOB|nr:hypothetical protein [Thalassococcus arenae]